MTYQRILSTGYGAPDVLQIFEADLPEPAPGEIRLKVLTAGVAWGDVVRRQAPLPAYPPPPFPIGYDVVGIVDKLGEGVTQFSVGQRVAGLTFTVDAEAGTYKLFGYSEVVVAPARLFVPVPENVDSAEAVCAVLNYLTAYQIYHYDAKVQSGERVLVHGGGGGVGTALLQLGKLLGLEIYATASTSKQALLKELGATPIDYKNEDFVEVVRRKTGDGIDVVIDPIAGDYVERNYGLLRPNGRLIVYGLSSMASADVPDQAGPAIEAINALTERTPDKTVKFFAGVDDESDHYHNDLSTLLNLLAEGKIKPIIGARFPLAQASAAHAFLEKAAVPGKIVLEVGDR